MEFHLVALFSTQVTFLKYTEQTLKKKKKVYTMKCTTVRDLSLLNYVFLPEVKVI